MSVPRKVLVVDDETHIVELLRLALEDEGYQVSVAMDGEEALSKAVTEKPDIISLDINMPGMSGFEVCRRLKARDETKGMPVVFISAYAQEEDIRKGLDLGATAYMPKPLNLREYLDTFNRILGGG